jgi:hypothetical protein
MANSAVMPRLSAERWLVNGFNRRLWFLSFIKNYSIRVGVLTVGKLVRPVVGQPVEFKLESPFMFSQLTTRTRHFGPVALGFA